MAGGAGPCIEARTVPHALYQSARQHVSFGKRKVLMRAAVGKGRDPPVRIHQTDALTGAQADAEESALGDILDAGERLEVVGVDHVPGK